MAAATGAAVTLKGFLRTDVPLPYLRRGFWLLAGPQMLITATQAGWDIETYAHWVKDTVTGLLIGPDYQKNKDR